MVWDDALTTDDRLNSRKASRGRGINEEDNVGVEKQAKSPLSSPAVQNARVSGLDFGQVPVPYLFVYIPRG